MVDLKQISKLLKEFEKRNNVSVYFTYHSDDSMEICEFWEDTQLLDTKSHTTLIEFLSIAVYEKNSQGYAKKPLKRVI